jgi:NAD(P)-dependent dehydrogenase (short-subunit alcohol dehydrogenase family)
MNADLSGRTVVVTGASSGFGRHFAATLARHGAKVVAVARRRELLEGLVDEIAASGGQAEAVSLDVTRAEDVSRAFAALERIDVLVNNAGVGGGTKATDLAESEWRWTYDVNVNASWFVAREAALKMIAAGRGGSIVNIASITGLRPGGSSAAYASSKAAVIHLTKALALEWARHGIRVNAIAPGYFETDLNRDFLRSEPGAAMMKRIPQRRFGRMEDLEGPLLLLASDASAYMTGSVLEVDGGHLVSAL